MKLAIQIDGHPAGSGAANSGYQFIKAALARNHRIVIVFFYYDGVFAGLPAPAADGEPGSPPQWGPLARDHDLDLVVCSAAVERRGMLGDADSPQAALLAEGFRIGGLAQWVDACIRCDRLVRFAA